MSLLQAIVSTSSSGSAPPPAPYYNVYQSGGMNEGVNVTIMLDVANIVGVQTIYWEIVGDAVNYPNNQATPGVDLTSNNGFSGSFNVTGTGTYTLATLNNVADNTTEGTEWYAVKIGTSFGAYDIGYYGAMNINDISQGGPMPGGTGTADTGSWNGITYTLTPTVNGTGNVGTANSGDTITWTITSSPADTSGRTMYWWVDNNTVPANDFVENVVDGTVTLNGSGTGTFSLTVASSPSSHALFRMYVGMSLYQGFVTHGYIGV